MKTLIKLELKRNNIRTYVISSFIIAITMLGFLYLFAYIPVLEPNDTDMAIYFSYSNIIPLFEVLNMTAFCVLAAVMYSKFVIEDYSGKRPILLFSYPVSRKKVILSKLSVVGIFIIISMVISNLTIFLIFAITERNIHLVAQEFTFSIMLEVVGITLFMSLIAVSIGIIAVGIGFIKKSVATTIISAVLIASLMCNIVANTTLNKTIMCIIGMLLLLVGIVFLLMMIKKVDIMEAE